MKRITYKYYWYTCLWLIMGFLSIMDVMTTLIALNIPNTPFYEANPGALMYVSNPYLWYFNNFIILFILWVIGVILWWLDRKKEITVDIVTIGIMIAMIIFTVIKLITVLNNIFQFYYWLR